VIELTPQEIVDAVVRSLGEQVAFRNYENDIAFANEIVRVATAKLLKQSDDNAARAHSLLDQMELMKKEYEEMRARKDSAYEERNRLVALMATMAQSSGIRKTAIEGWNEAWHNCVYIDTTQGQMSWHYHDSQAHLFAHLPPYDKEWDGHTTEQKYLRLQALINEMAGIVMQ